MTAAIGLSGDGMRAELVILPFSCAQQRQTGFAGIRGYFSGRMQYAILKRFSFYHWQVEGRGLSTATLRENQNIHRLPNRPAAAPIPPRGWSPQAAGMKRTRERAVDQDSRHIVIAGAGHAGGSAAAMLRQLGWTGAITLIGEEPLPPYQRPPLSKAWLTGEATAESLALRPAKFYLSATIDLRLGIRVTGIDRSAKRVALSDGETVAYDYLILALGARARRLPLPGAGLDDVLELRSAADADRLKAALRPGAKLAVIGGGYIGLEAAASARALGAEVTVIERESRVLARVACPILSEFFQTYHRAKGVAIEVNAEVATLEGADGKIAGVRLGDGRLIPCSAALIGVGAVANDELAREAGLTCHNGIVVDLDGAHGRSGNFRDRRLHQPPAATV